MPVSFPTQLHWKLTDLVVTTKHKSSTTQGVYGGLALNEQEAVQLAGTYTKQSHHGRQQLRGQEMRLLWQVVIYPIVQATLWLSALSAELLPLGQQAI